MPGITFTDNQLTAPVWAGDFLNREHLVPGGAKVNAAQFNATDAVAVTADGNAGAGATSITCLALSGPIPAGTLLRFGAGKYAYLDTAAAEGDTSLSVEALPAQIDDADQATYPGEGRKSIPSGTPIGRTFAERANGDAFGPADAGDDEIYLVAFDVTDAEENDDVDLYRHGGVVKENKLPDWDGLAAGVQTAIRAAYTTTVGAA